MSASTNWQPTAKLDILQARATIINNIRTFFAIRDILEVETPLLSRFGVTDLHINTIPVLLDNNEQYYLQTSPEYGMKRLLAAGCGAIYQITHAFRGGDVGSAHNPEFTMLEWYRTGINHFQLMAEVDELLQNILQTKPAKIVSYQELFEQYLSFNPHIVTIDKLQEFIAKSDINFSIKFIKEATLNDLLNVLFSYCIEPNLIGDCAWIVYNYPVSQAALAKISEASGIAVAERFEVYVQGMELANGYHELTDHTQQLIRFEQDNMTRAKLNKPIMAIDDRLLAALESGLPECAGIALGIDRLVMLAIGATNIKDVIAFPIDRA